ncbi:hypothetical protein ACG83_21710 [Frankia sp. R43]|nr:hypothetical protein ACG83_21710 [Frankia sp. R43]
MAVVVQGDASDGVEVGFECVQRDPLGRGEVLEEVPARGGRLVVDEAGVDAFGWGDDAPSGDGDRGAVGVAVDEDA